MGTEFYHNLGGPTPPERQDLLRWDRSARNGKRATGGRGGPGDSASGFTVLSDLV